MAPKTGLYANIHKKRARIKRQKAAGKTPEKMRKVGSKGAPTKKNFKQAAKTAKPIKKKMRKQLFGKDINLTEKNACLIEKGKEEIQ